MKKEVVITGLGVESSIGADLETFWNSLCEGKSGIGLLKCIKPESDFQVMASELPMLKARDYLEKSQKKNVKVMSRDIQIGFVAAALACQDAKLVTQGDERNVDPDRFGVIFGSDLIATDIFELVDAVKPGFDENGNYDFSTWAPSAAANIMPLWMLKFLPNMPASHIGIAHDARGPSNTPTLCRVSGLASVFEAARIIERGAADVMICGSCGNHVNPVMVARSGSTPQAPLQADPSSVPRPFDADRCGTVVGEGGAAFILESREFAEARGAKPYAVIRGFANSMKSAPGERRERLNAIKLSIELALKDAGVQPNNLAHVNAEGLGAVDEDAMEAEAIRDTLGDVPVISQKGNIGELSSGSGSVELVASILSLQKGLIPPTRNYEKPAPDCPVNVVHGTPKPSSKSFAMKISRAKNGNSCALIVEKCECVRQ